MAEEKAREVVDEAEEKLESSNGKSRLSGLMSKDILLPAAATAAAAAAAGLAAKKGPDVMKMLGSDADQKAEELGRKGVEGAKKELGAGGGVAGKAASKLLGGKSGGGQTGGKTRRLPIQRWTDVAVPVEKAYKAWTQFEEYPKFMHRVLEVKQDDDDKNKVHWREKIWFSTREWDAEITDKRQNDRIAWKSVSGTHHSGVVSFHRLDKNLTRILVTVDFVPSGMVEKMASGMRFVKRAIQADLARFKAYIEFGDAKELEYRSQPEEMEQHRSGDDDEAEEAQGREEPKGEEDSSDESEEGSSDKGNEDRESDRRDRESRRQERREALSSS